MAVRRKRKKKKITFVRVTTYDEQVDPTEQTSPSRNKKLPKKWLYQNMVVELYQFLKKYKPETWGDTLGMIFEWEKNDQYEIIIEAAGGEKKRSQFMTDLLWHISTFGPNEKINY